MRAGPVPVRTWRPRPAWRRRGADGGLAGGALVERPRRMGVVAREQDDRHDGHDEGDGGLAHRSGPTILRWEWAPASPTPTRAPTSPASGAAARWPASSRACAASPTTSRTCCPFEEVVAALGRTRRARPRRADDRARLDRRHRRPPPRRVRPRVPAASPGARGRWERIAEARRRGEAMPPIDVYRIGDLHFVKDGHHRVSVARALGDTDIEAHVSEVRTKLGAGPRAADARPAAQAARARVPRARPAARRGRASGSSSPTSGATRSSPRSSRPGASAPATRASSSVARRRWPSRGSARSTSRSSTSLARGGASAARAPRPSATCASPCCASCCCTRTTGATTSSSACSARSAPRRRRGGHDGAPDPQGAGVAPAGRGRRRGRRPGLTFVRGEPFVSCRPCPRIPRSRTGSPPTRTGRRRGSRVVVARRRALPDLPALLHGHQRRRRRRPARHHRAARPPPVARRRRHLARPDHGLAQRRLGLRRRRLLRRRTPTLGTLADARRR